eukprot:s7949_g1.t1
MQADNPSFRSWLKTSDGKDVQTTFPHAIMLHHYFHGDADAFNQALASGDITEEMEYNSDATGRIIVYHPARDESVPDDAPGDDVPGDDGGHGDGDGGNGPGDDGPGDDEEVDEDKTPEQKTPELRVA